MPECCNCISNMNENLHSVKNILITKEKQLYLYKKCVPNMQDSDCL